MTPEDKKTMEAWGKARSSEIQLTLSVGDDAAGRSLADFCDNLSRHAPRLTVHRRRPEKDDDLPAIILSPRVRYHAAPFGPELPPFLSFLSGDGGGDGLPAERREALAVSEVPALFQVFVAPQCPFCPETVRRLLALADLAPGVKLAVIDAALFPEYAAKHDVKSVPSVILDGRYRWTGSVDLSELCRLMLDRDPAQLSALSLQGVIEDGNAGQVVEMMVTAGKLFPAVFELLTDEKWPIRLGAMVALESLSDRDSDLAAAAVSSLLDLLPDVSHAVQGDILYLLGEMGGASLFPELESYRASGGTDAVREAASDAMEAIGERIKDGS